MRQIITVATMKGGSGKSTLASCLAVHWHMRGRPSTIIDADPQRWISRWHETGSALENINVVSYVTQATIQSVSNS